MKTNKTKFLAAAMLMTTIALTSCSYQVKLIETESTGTTKNSNKVILFENDTVLVEYSLWADRGIMMYSIFNKLSVPIYVDWKKAAYVKNNQKFIYYEEKTISQGSTLTTLNKKNQNPTVVSKASTITEERITFIPPRSFVYNPVKYELMRDNYTIQTTQKSDNKIRIEALDIKKDPAANAVKVPKSWKKSGQVKVWEKSFTKENNPMVFKNFLTISTTERFDREFYVENEFWITKITQMGAKQFNGKKTKGTLIVKKGYKTHVNKITLYEYPYKSNDSFYIPIYSNF
jgi:hypothetical protein